MTVYYDSVLPQVESVFDGYGFIVGSAPSREGDEPVFHVLAETDVRSPVRRPDSDRYRRWEVARADRAELRDGYIVRADALASLVDAARSDVGR